MHDLTTVVLLLLQLFDAATDRRLFFDRRGKERAGGVCAIGGIGWGIISALAVLLRV